MSKKLIQITFKYLQSRRFSVITINCNQTQKLTLEAIKTKKLEIFANLVNKLCLWKGHAVLYSLTRVVSYDIYNP